MINTRAELIEYAIKILIPAVEKAANRRASDTTIEVVDWVGYLPSQLEEMFRPFWGLAPLLRETDREFYINVLGERVEICKWIQNVLVEGVSENSKYSWDKNKKSIGFMFDFQNLTEIAGLLVGIFFAKERLWEPIPYEEKKMIADWIYNGCLFEFKEKKATNNHIWFPILCATVLKKLGFVYPDVDMYIEEGLDKLDAMYLSNGWYSDGQFGRFDYYEAWSMHSYPLLWCIIEDKSFSQYEIRQKKYIERTEEFLKQYMYFFDCDGACAPFGRSLSYRFAASCVFPLAVIAGCNVDIALAKSITLKNISYFEKNCLPSDNNILPPGYLYNAPSIVENYTSSGGAYWASKTFLCLLMDESHPFWTTPFCELPAEKGNYIVKPQDKTINMAVASTKSSGVTVFNNIFQYYQDGKYCNPFNDMSGYYNKFVYNSKSGFAVSTRDNISYDNMIGLITPDCAMSSHRYGFTNLGTEEDFMLSLHKPFANDSSTSIKTWLLPLDNGFHVRVHKVTLSQSYSICEGGFSIGLYDDYREHYTDAGTFFIKNKKFVSLMKTVSDTDFNYEEKRPNPGMHLLAPYAVYPCYKTKVMDSGVYWFASVFGFFEEELKNREIPELVIKPDNIEIFFEGKSYIIQIL